MNDANVANGANLGIEQDNVHWRKSSRSNFSGNCVEIATEGTVVLVRDSKDPGLVVQLSPSRWVALVDFIKKANP